MKGPARAAVLAASMVLCLALAAHAAPAGHAKVLKALDALRLESPGLKVNAVAGNPIPHGIFGINLSTGALAPERAARAFLDRFAPLYTLDLPGMSLETRRVVETGYGHVVQLEARYLGLDIVGGTLNVAVDRASRILSVTTGLRPMTAIETRPGLNELDAWRQALSFVDWRDRPIVRSFDKRGARLVVLTTNAGPVLAYAVSVSQAANMRYWIVYIDARTGKFLFKRPNALFLNQAKIYDPNPGYAMDAPLVDVTFDDFVDNDHITDKTLNGVRIITKNCAGASDPQDLFEYGGTLYRGPLCDMIFKTQADANGDFTAQPLDPTECVTLSLSTTATQAEKDACFEKNAYDEFAEVMMYYHANKAYNYFRGFGLDHIRVSPIVAGVNLKIPDMYEFFPSCANPTTQGKDKDGNDVTICTATRFMPYDNAMYAPYDPNNTELSQFFGVTQDAILFGQGSVIDFSYDADVIYHEFTHAVIQTVTDNQMLNFDEYGMVIEVGAVNEGMADYFSSAITGDPKTGNYARHADPDPNSTTMAADSIRDISIGVKCLDDTWGEVHQDGLVISNATWEARKLFTDTFPAKDVTIFDKAVFDSMAQWGSVPYFKTVADSILESLKNNPEIGDSFATAARAKFAANRADDCPRVLKLQEGIAKPIVFTDAYGQLNYWPGYFQFSYDVPADATKIYMGFEAQGSGYGGTLDVRVLFRKDDHVVFNTDVMFSGTVTAGPEGEVTEVTPDADNYYSLQVPDLVPGHTYYMAIANYGDSAILQNVFMSYGNAPVDGGTPDAEVDAGADGAVVTADSGTDDAGPDAGADGGVEPDAEVADGGVTPDASPAPDAGPAGAADAGAAASEDAGTAGGGATGCSCASVGL